MNEEQKNGLKEVLKITDRELEFFEYVHKRELRLKIIIFLLAAGVCMLSILLLI